MNIFTHKERTVKSINVGFIVSQVRAVLDLKNVRGLCLNKLPTDNGQQYTVEEASKIIDDVVWDSIYHN